MRHVAAGASAGQSDVRGGMMTDQDFVDREREFNGFSGLNRSLRPRHGIDVCQGCDNFACGGGSMIDPSWNGNCDDSDPRNGELTARIHQQLQASGYIALRNVQVVAVEGGVMLQGRVPTYFLKQIARATALTNPEITNVIDDLVVC